MKTIEKIIQSSTTPLRQDVVWIDTSDPSNPVVKIYVNGKWEISQPGSESNVTVKSLSKEEYDALEEKDKDTLYIVKNDPTELDPTYDIYLGESKIVDNSSKISDYDKSILDPGEDQYAYGVLIDFTQGKSSYDLTRIGNMDLHRTLPVQSQYKGCIWDMLAQSIVTYLNPEDWSLATEDKTAEEIDELLHDGAKSIRVETPKFYATSKVLATDGAGNTTMAKVMFSTQKLNPWYIEVPKMVTDFRNVRINEDGYWPVSTLDSSNFNILGGFCSTKNNYDSAQYILHPITNIDRQTMRESAKNNNTNIFSYEAYKWIIYWAFVIEYATLFTAKPMITELDENGFHQGGLGPGMTSIESYGAKYSDDSYIYNEDYNIQDSFYLGANYFQSNSSDEFPLRDIGVTNNWGNRTGENIVEYTRNGKTSHVHQNRYRGFEFPFGDIQMNLDGFLGYTFKDDNDVAIAEAYFTCSDPAKFKDELPSEYDANDFDKGWRLALWNDKLDSFNREGYDEGAAKAMCIGNNGDLFATKWFINKGRTFDKYFVNYNYPIDGGQNTTLRVGSLADYDELNYVGLGYLNAFHGVGDADSHLGFRCFNIIQD